MYSKDIYNLPYTNCVVQGEDEWIIIVGSMAWGGIYWIYCMRYTFFTLIYGSKWNDISSAHFPVVVEPVVG